MSNHHMSPEFSRLIASIVGSMNPKDDEEKAIKDYIRLVLLIARKYIRPNVEYEDLISVGLVGLIEAVRHFDPSRSTNFGGYATTRINGRMYEYCISNMTTIYVPTHVGKAKVYVEKMTRLLDKEPLLFRNGTGIEEIISCREHEIETQLSKTGVEELRSLKEKVSKIANNSRTTYEELVSLAYKGMVTELGEEDSREFVYSSTEEEIEQEVTVREVTDSLVKDLGPKKTAVLVLHHQGYNNEDIADKLHEGELTETRITRQAVRGLLITAEKKAKKNVKK